MHHKYGKKDLVILSIATDVIEPDFEPRNTPEKVAAAVRKFLKDFKAPFDTLVIGEVEEAKLHFSAPPCAFVFDRQGKWTQFVPEPSDGGDMNKYSKRIEDLAVKLLNEK